MACISQKLISPSSVTQSSPSRCHVEFAFPRPSRVLDAVVEELRVAGLNRPSTNNHLNTLTSLLRVSLFRSQLPPPQTTSLFTTPSSPNGILKQFFGSFTKAPGKSIAAVPSLEPETGTAERDLEVPMPAAQTVSTPGPASIAAPTDTNPVTSAVLTPSAISDSPHESPVELAPRVASWSDGTSTTQSSSPPQALPSPSQTNNTSMRRVSTSSNSDQKPRSSSGFLRRLSPNLAARVKLLDGTASTTNSTARNLSPIGKIPQEHLKELDSLHQDLSIKVQKRGRAWGGGGGGRSTTHTPEPVSTNDGCEERRPSACVDDREADSPVQPSETVTTTTEEDTAMSIAGSDLQAVADSTGSSHGTHTNPPQVPTDLEKYLRKSVDESDIGPPPPPKDSPPPPPPSGDTNAESYFNPLGLHRTDSIYSFSRASFSNQLSQLTSISLPQPSTLEASIVAIPTASSAVRALSQAAEQIQKWINKASEVLSGLDADDDVEWAAAGGREGLEDVDKAVTKFESLISVYVNAIEDVQLRNDIAEVGANQLNGIVIQMESTLQKWGTVRSLLKGVKAQVELAMEWEELWNAVLGDVGLEIENLARLIFEMEEKRHKTVISDVDHDPSHGLDINELETIVEESPANASTPSDPRFSFAPVYPPGTSQLTPQTSQNPQDEATLLALFARMQPLRASLDFLPMRLSMFQSRAESIFPSACEELEDRRQRLEKGYKKLGTDAEALRRELGEDRWIIVFRNAGKQAEKMCESVERSVSKLQEAIDGGIQHNNPAALAKRAENFEQKKVHYGSAIERVLSIIQKGINDRLTVNGEVIRLLADLRARYESLQDKMNAMDFLLYELTARNQQMRDSMSSSLTMDTPGTRSAVGTAESSPASSVIMSNGAYNGKNGSRRSSATANPVSRTAAASKLRRYSALPQPVSPSSQTPKRKPVPRSSSVYTDGLKSPTPRLTTTSPSPTPTPRPGSRTSGALTQSKPRWNSSANVNDLMVGHNFKPLSLTTPSPHRKLPVPSRTGSSTFPPRSPLSRESSASPAPGLRPGSRLNRGVTSPLPDRGVSPSPRHPSSLIDPPPYSKLRKPLPSTPSSGLASTPRSRQSYAGIPSTRESSVASTRDGGDRRSSRPGTAMGYSNRRTSLLPMPKGRSGRESAASNREDRPPWRF